MKFGLRKKLQRDNIPCEMLDLSQNNIIINKVLIQLYHPRQFFQGEETEIIQKLSDPFELVIMIFDFVDFKQEYEGEKFRLKERVKYFNKPGSYQVIAIDNSEELFFIIKSIYEQSHKGVH